MVSDSAKKRLEAKKAAKSAKLHGSAKPSPAVSQSQVGPVPLCVASTIPMRCNNVLSCICAYTTQPLTGAHRQYYESFDAVMHFWPGMLSYLNFVQTQSEANLDQLISKENGLGALDINGKEEKNILESQRAVTGGCYSFPAMSSQYSAFYYSSHTSYLFPSRKGTSCLALCVLCLGISTPQQCFC